MALVGSTIIDQFPDNGFKGLMCPFDAPVRLWVIRSRFPMFCSHMPQVTSKVLTFKFKTLIRKKYFRGSVSGNMMTNKIVIHSFLCLGGNRMGVKPS